MKRPRILIVDDDTMVRIGLKTVIDWEENGFVLVGEAHDGREALALAQERCPDIIITDIKMPGMDGIALIERLRAQESQAEILVLSSYDEFDLVKRALKLGARDYLLKLNLEPAELVRCLRAIASEPAPAAPPFPGEDEKSRALLRQNFLWDVVSGFYLDEAQLERSMRDLDIRLDTRPVYCMIVKAGELYRFEEATAEEIQTLRYSVINITEEIVGDVFCGYCFSGRTGEFDVLLAGRAGAEDALVAKLAHRLRRMLLEYLNLSCTVLVGSSEKPGGAGIKEAFWRANAVLAHRFYLDHDGVLFWRGDMQPLRQDSYSLSGVRAELGDILVSGSTGDLARVLNRLAEDMKQLALSRSAVRSVALELFYIVQEYFERNDLPAARLLPRSYRTYEQLLHMESLREVTGWMGMLRDDLAAFLRRESEKGYPKIVGTVLDWIAAHYRESASLQEAARVAGLNPSYLSALLKKYTGKSYIELLTEYRVERAKELLVRTGEKVYRVGQMVGYEDKYYFGRVFKRVTGMSPGEFKNQKREG